MKTITVNIFAGSNWKQLPDTVSTLLQARNLFPNEIRVKVLTGKSGKQFLAHSFERESKLKVYCFESYWAKALVAYASSSDLTIKLDDDIWMTVGDWHEFLKSSLMTRDFEVCSPVISTGIPSVEQFLEHYLTPEESEEVRKILGCVPFPKSLWGADYSSLDGLYSKGYSSFQKGVDALETDFKGIHPIRISHEAQVELLELGMKAQTRGRLTGGKSESTSSTYFCNNVFACTRRTGWSLVFGVLRFIYRFDGYDEVGLNQMLRHRGGINRIALNSLAIHPSYNSAPKFNSVRESMFERIRSHLKSS